MNLEKLSPPKFIKEWQDVLTAFGVPLAITAAASAAAWKFSAGTVPVNIRLLIGTHLVLLSGCVTLVFLLRSKNQKLSEYEGEALPPESEAMLAELADCDPQQQTASYVFFAMQNSLGTTASLHFWQLLEEGGYVDVAATRRGSDPEFTLSHKGRKYLIQNRIVAVKNR